MIREELAQIVGREARHRTLVARLVLAGVLTVVVDLIGAALTYASEHDARA